MMDLETWVKIAALVGVPISLIGLFLNYLAQRKQKESTQQQIADIKTEMIILQKQTKGTTFYSCTFYNSQLDERQIMESYQKVPDQLEETSK